MKSDSLRSLSIDFSSANVVFEETMRMKEAEMAQAYSVVGYVMNLQFVLYVESESGQLGYQDLMNVLEEMKIELQGSAFSASHGFYRNAIASLRSTIELCFQGLYGYHSPAEHQKWLNGQKKTIGIKAAIDHLKSKNVRFRKYDQAYRFKDSTYSFYRDLCKYVHVEGVPAFESETRNDIVPKFNEQAFNQWMDHLIKTWEIIAITFLLIFPFIMDVSKTVRQSLLQKLPDDSEFLIAHSIDSRKEIIDSLTSGTKYHLDSV